MSGSKTGSTVPSLLSVVSTGVGASGSIVQDRARKTISWSRIKPTAGDDLKGASKKSNHLVGYFFLFSRVSTSVLLLHGGRLGFVWMLVMGRHTNSESNQKPPRL